MAAAIHCKCNTKYERKFFMSPADVCCYSEILWRCSAAANRAYFEFVVSLLFCIAYNVTRYLRGATTYVIQKSKFVRTIHVSHVLNKIIVSGTASYEV